MANDTLDTLVGDWLTLDEAAAALGLDLRRVRRLLQERQLLAISRRIPAQLILDGAPVPDLAGTVTLLADAGYSDEEALTWLFTPDETLPGPPIAALRSGHKKTEVRRRAQAMAF